MKLALLKLLYINLIKMNLPKPKKINAERYVAGLSLFKQKTAKIKLSANESALGPSPKAIKEFSKVAKNLKRYPDSDGVFLRKVLSKKFKLDPKELFLAQDLIKSLN